MRSYKSISPAVRCTRLTAKSRAQTHFSKSKYFTRNVENESNDRTVSIHLNPTQPGSVSRLSNGDDEVQILGLWKVLNCLIFHFKSTEHLLSAIWFSRKEEFVFKGRAGRISLRRPVLFDYLFVFNKYWRRRRIVQSLHQQSPNSPG